MASPRWSTSMLLASLILLLYWTTSSAQSHDSTSTDLSPPHRVRRALPFRTREEVAASMQTAKDVLNFINDRIGKKNIETLSSVMKGISNIASMAPVIGGLVSSIVNVVLAFVPQENPLNELREGFAEVNRKLDSLSLQISNLATDVEWFNYASVYSQDEVRILFKTVSKAQISAVKFCLDNYKKYMKKDMEEIGKAMNPDDKTSIADQVKKALDKKYNWYNWVVLVYNTDQEQNYIYRYNMTNVPVGKITVAVDYTQKTNEERKEEVKNQLTSCYKERRVGLGMAARVERKLCEDIKHKKLCRNEVAGVPVTEYIKVMYSSHSTANDFVVDPNALQSFECEWGHFKAYNIHIYYSKSLPVCDPDPCKNKGECERLLDSNEWLCECPDCYYGDRCEKDSEIRRSPVAKLEHPEPDISTLKIMLDKILKRLGLTSSNQ